MIGAGYPFILVGPDCFHPVSVKAEELLHAEEMNIENTGRNEIACIYNSSCHH
jgi:hypothetical protein